MSDRETVERVAADIGDDDGEIHKSDSARQECVYCQAASLLRALLAERDAARLVAVRRFVQYLLRDQPLDAHSVMLTVWEIEQEAERFLKEGA